MAIGIKLPDWVFAITIIAMIIVMGFLILQVNSVSEDIREISTGISELSEYIKTK